MMPAGRARVFLLVVCFIFFAVPGKSAEDPPLVREGLALMEAGKYDRAIAKFTEHLKTKPDDPFAYNDRGIAYKSKSEFKHAIADFSEALRRKPDWWFAYYNRGSCYQAEGAEDAAIADFTRSLNGGPKNSNPLRMDALLSRAHCYFNQEKAEPAMADLNLAIKLGAKDPDAFVLRGILYKVGHNYDKSLADYEKAIALDPKDPRSYSVEAYLLSACPMPKYRNAKKALSYATKACELTNWQRGDYLQDLAAAHAEAGQFEEAIKWQTKAGEMDPKRVDSSRLDLYRKSEPFRDLNRKGSPIASLKNVQTKVAIRLGQKLNAKFQVRDEKLIEPAISTGGKAPANSLSLDFHQEKRGRTLYLTHSFRRTLQARCLIRLAGYDTYFETDILPVPVNIINPEIWSDPIEELVLFDFKLTGSSQPLPEESSRDVAEQKIEDADLARLTLISFNRN
jgi:tetratricopeptide (TPR) repeat protein